MLSPAKKQARFYRLEIWLDLFGGFSLIREYGRIGQPGRLQFDPTPFPRKHAVITAGGLLRWRGGRSAAGSSRIGDDLAQVFDAVSGAGGHPILADTVEPKATVFGEHVDRQIEDPIFVFAEQSGEVADREDGADRRHDQAAWLRGAEPDRQFHGSNSSCLWAGCPAMRARTSASQACRSTSFSLAVTIRL